MDEQGARKVVLARIIETIDTQGTLLGRPEIDEIDRQAAAQARAGGLLQGPERTERFLKQRAEHILQRVGQRNLRLASLQNMSPWQRTGLVAIPLAALALGVLGDQVANPHQVNLLSKPLLLILLWNLLVYLLLAWRAVAALGRGSAGTDRFIALRGWLAQWRDRHSRAGIRAQVTAAFYAQWHGVTGALQGQRIARVMHWSAAGWAAGVALSIVFGGLFAQYRVGWESTFFDAGQVHRFLRILLLPVTQIAPWADFSQAQVAQLEVGAGGTLAGQKEVGQRWVFLYVMLLSIVVIAPRVLLAAWAHGRERALAGAVDLGLADSYYQRVLSLLTPTQVRLALYAQGDADRAALLARLRDGGRGQTPRAAPSAAGTGTGAGAGPVAAATHVLATESGGGFLELVHLADAPIPLESSMDGRIDRPVDPSAARWPLIGGWLQRVMQPRRVHVEIAEGSLQQLRRDADVVLYVVARAQDAHPMPALLQWLDKPVLVLVRESSGSARPDAPVAGEAPVKPAVKTLHFEQFAQSWLQEPVLLDAIAACLPDYKQAGFERLAADRRNRHATRLRDSMAVLADQLLDAARQSRTVASAPTSLKSLVSSKERDAWDRSRQAAMDEIVEALQRKDAAAMDELLRLHQLNRNAALQVSTSLQEEFEVAKGGGTSRATLAGAASGAAMGAGIDLMTVGLSLGLAAAAGAVVGGGLAFIASAWKGAGNDTLVQLSDEMLQAMVEVALLRYLAVTAWGSDANGEDTGVLQPAWRSEVVAAVEAANEALKQRWGAERSQRPDQAPQMSLSMMLEDVAMKVLRRLYPENAK